VACDLSGASYMTSGGHFAAVSVATRRPYHAGCSASQGVMAWKTECQVLRLTMCNNAKISQSLRLFRGAREKVNEDNDIN